MFIRKFCLLLTITSLIQVSTQHIEAVTYVTDTGGYAFDQSRSATNLAAGIALSTVALAGIIAIAVQNSHGSHSSSNGHYGNSSYSH
jgi:hypothetical protein